MYESIPTSPELYQWLPLVFVALVVILENAVIIVAFVKDNRLREKSSNLLLLNQSVADLITAFLYIPCYIAKQFGKDRDWSLYVGVFILFLSLFSLCILALDRYLMIIKPFLHIRWMSVEKTSKIIMAIWIMPVIFSLLPVTWWFLPERNYIHMRFLVFMWLLTLVLTLLLIIVYFRVFWFTRRYIQAKTKALAQKQDKDLKAEVQKMKREVQVTLLFSLILLCFVLAYASTIYTNLACILLHQSDLCPPWIISFCTYSFILNSAVNPILTLTMKLDYKRALRFIIKSAPTSPTFADNLQRGTRSKNKANE